MRRKTSKAPLIDYKTISEKVDPQILSLFPTLSAQATNRRKKDALLKNIACIYAIGYNGSISILQLSKLLKVSLSGASRILKKLLTLSLIEAVKNKKIVNYNLTAKGIITLTSFKEYQTFDKIQKFLATPQKKGDKLAYALLVIGNSINNKNDTVFVTLTKYAMQGHNLEQISSDIAAISILEFYRTEFKSNIYPSNYIGVFKEFTTTGFQEILKILLSAMKPTVEDYNWLIEFFNTTVEFHYNPERLAYVNLLSKEPNLKLSLEEYKKAQEKQVKKQGSQFEVTFNIPNSNLEKFPTMPPYLKAIIMRLILEPTQFINKELNEYFFK